MNKPKRSIDAPEADLNWIKTVVQQHCPNAKILVFGSRLKGTARAYSDLDIAVDQGQKIPTAVLFALQDALEESDLNYRVDCLDFYKISPEFQKIILADYHVL